MKAAILVIALSIAGKACLAQANFYYTSGRLFVDPTTSQEINSPFLSYFVKDRQKWIAYDPKATEGRFVGVSSSYSSAVACGYVKGPFNFLGNRIVTPSDEYTAVAVSVKQNKEVEWFYAHNTGIVPSKFHWVQKLRDGMTLLSGHEYEEQNKTAILLRVDKTGELTWSKRLDGEIGLEVHATSADRIYWMTSNVATDQVTIYEIDHLTGDILNRMQLTGKTANEGIRASKTFYLSETGLMVARLSDTKAKKILIDEYTLEGSKVQHHELSYLLDYHSVFELQGVTQRPNGTIQLALNLNGSISLEDNDPIHTSSTKEILLVTMDESGYLLGTEKYGSKDAGVSGIYRFGEKVVITGSHKGQLDIQSQTLPYDASNTTAQSYLVYLDAYDPMAGLHDLDPQADLPDLTIFPNPITTESHITILNEFVEPEVPYEIRVYDNNARAQFQQTGKTRFESSRDELNVSSLPSGLFHVFVLQNETVISRGKFIITR